MRRTSLRLAVCVLGGLLAAVGAAADGAAVYVNRSIVVASGDLSLGDLIHPSGAPSSEQKEALATSLAVVSNRMLYIPVTAYLPRLDVTFGADAIIVGSRSLVIPKGLVPDAETSLLDRLVDSLQAQGLFTEGITEIELSQNSARATIPSEGTPAIQVQTTMRGTTEASFSLAGTTGKISFLSTRNDSATSVKQGAAVDVVFHKGQITIEMPGTALGAGASGDMVKVLVLESQKSFTGRLANGKVVNVDLP